MQSVMQNLSAATRILKIAAGLEIGTGVAVIIFPALVAWLLIGVEVSGSTVQLFRCFGIAIVALGLASLPGGGPNEIGRPALRAMLTYNVLIAVYFVYLRAFESTGGILLWPAVAFHAALAVFLLWINNRQAHVRLV